MWCLHPQQADSLQHKAIDKMLAALGLYDIENVFVPARDLAQAGLEQVLHGAQIIDEQQVAELFQTAAQVIRL